MHRGPNAIIDAVGCQYIHDFLSHASTPSFLLYEIWSQQIDQFMHIQTQLEEDVERLRLSLQQTVDTAALDGLAHTERVNDFETGAERM